jgi:hypothetical protein
MNVEPANAFLALHMVFHEVAAQAAPRMLPVGLINAGQLFCGQTV